MPQKVVVYCCSVLFSLNALAQQVPVKDSVHYDLHISSTAVLSGGNLERIVSQNRLTGTIGGRHIQFVTENSYRYGKNFSRVVENDILTRGYIRIFPTSKLYAFVLGTYEDNFKRSIESRWQAGAGSAYNFYQKKREFFRVSIAVVYEQARYKVDTFNISSYNGQSKIDETRVAFRLGGIHGILQNRLVLRHDTWFMVGVKNKRNYRWHSLVGLQAPLYRGLSLKADYEYTYESLAIGSKSPFGFPSRTFDWVLTFGLSYDIGNKSAN